MYLAVRYRCQCDTGKIVLLIIKKTMLNTRTTTSYGAVNTNSAAMAGASGLGSVLFLLFAAIGIGLSFALTNFVPGVVGVILGLFIFSSVRIAQQWEKAIILRLGKYNRTAGPGLFFLIPVLDKISSLVDTRVRLTAFKAEQTLSRDTVPVDVDAVLFWFVWDPEKASLAVSNYEEAVSWAAQTALRDTIGKTDLANLLAGRSQIEYELKKMIDERTEPWGITVQSVEMRDVLIPEALQDAMSKEAQAQRERHARVILSQAEVEVAQKFDIAAQIYASNPTALSLRSMNMLAEAIKERGALVIVPSNSVETLGMGTVTGLSALSQQTFGDAPRIVPKEPNPTTSQSAATNGTNGSQPQPPQQPGQTQPYTPWPQNGSK